MSAAPAVRTRRHEIGDALYDLFEDYDGQLPSHVNMWPVVKVTERFVYVTGAHFYDRDRVRRFDRARLETEGSAYNRPSGLLLYTRPLLDWPPLVVSVSGPRQIEAAS